MTDTAKVLDIINNAKQMVTDAVEKVCWPDLALVLNIITVKYLGEAASSHEIEGSYQADTSR